VFFKRRLSEDKFVEYRVNAGELADISTAIETRVKGQPLTYLPAWAPKRTQKPENDLVQRPLCFVEGPPLYGKILARPAQ
jgi:hypothetical protein